MENAIIITACDDVVTVTREIRSGEDILFSADGAIGCVIARQDIPKYHKAAIHPVKKDCSVKKYGEHIGYATQDIEIGDHVHTHNLASKIKGD